MPPVLIVAVGVLVLLGVGAATLAFAISGIVELVGRRAVGRGLARLAFAGAAVAVPWLTPPLAEASTGWQDTDHDGMLDGFTNGSYDWVDRNASTWIVLTDVAAVAVLGVGIAVTRTRPSTAPVRGEGRRRRGSSGSRRRW